MSSMTGEEENSEGKRKAYFTVPCFCCVVFVKVMEEGLK